jgi:hypothetical protein
MILCCLGLAIFGISDVPDDNNGGGDEMYDMLRHDRRFDLNVPISTEQKNDVEIGGQTTEAFASSMIDGSIESKHENAMQISELD